MKKLKEIYNFIREKYKNPRTRAAVILSLYLIFFVFAFSFISFRTPNNTNLETENIQNYKNVSKDYNFEYNIEIKKNEISYKYLFTGTDNNQNSTYKMQLFNNETGVYEEIYDYEDINPKFIDLETIISYVNDIKEEFTTNYKDGTVQKNYMVNLSKIDSNITANETIEINVYEKENFITKIIIDGTNFDNKVNKDVTYSKYILNYSKINN